MKKNSGKNFQILLDLMNKLRSPKGCPWDRKQSFVSLKPALIEETYEVISAIDKKQDNKLKEELGDLLFLVIFYSQIAQEKNKFNIANILKGTIDKMVRRHPHVFGRKKAKNANEAYQRWHQAKRQEYNSTSDMLFDLPYHLPALMKAAKLQKKLTTADFSPADYKDIILRVDKALKNLKEAININKKNKISEELGGLLFSLVNLSRFLNVNSEEVLHKTIQKFISRLSAREKELKRAGKQLLNETKPVYF